MNLRHQLTLCVALVTNLLPGYIGAGGVSGLLNRAYLPARHSGSVRVLDFDLRKLGSFKIAGVEGMTGAAFNSEGKKVVIARRDDGVYVIEVTTSGSLVRQYDTGRGSLSPRNRRHPLARPGCPDN